MIDYNMLLEWQTIRPFWNETIRPFWNDRYNTLSEWQTMKPSYDDNFIEWQITIPFLDERW